ncbi:hypothetical protein HYS94_04095 [Candidatus Daviesbacteria bacterium]|nr:hypothetical protein [Candidatus Daviesbacteria bacterium]
MSSQLERRIKEHSKEELVRLTHTARTQIARLASGEIEFPTVRVERVGVGFQNIIPLTHQPAHEDVVAALSQVEHESHKVDLLLSLHRRFVDEIQIKTEEINE